MDRRIRAYLLAMMMISAAPSELLSSDDARFRQPPDQAAAPADLADLERGILKRAARLTVRKQLRDYLGTYPAASRRPSDKARVGQLLEDPAVAAYYPKIREQWFTGALSQWDGEPLFGNYREFLQCKIMIARNLFLRGLGASGETVRREYERIQALRGRYRDLGLFSQRRVIFAASGDRMRSTNDFVFASGPIRRRIEDQAKTFAFLRSAGGRSRSELTEELRKSAAGESSVTFVYDGHGRDTVLDFGGGFSFTRIMDALKSVPGERRSDPPILILSACRSHTLARKLLAGIHLRDDQIPILIVPDEFGQDYVKGVYQEPFFRTDLRISAREEAHLGMLFEGSRINASVYVPDIGNVAVQIA